ncbi:hypothetical protein HOY34_13050 [Xinfangfangia sp. D13-10-4-6]|uniref:hypothetical protein n=1 Tax=Pseudogemmobacter hezensis TaxID=2737662 RepID=UPI0015562810|nr:hypothetical protein [Pseudogemmobacter hezensis]NPD16126.1 hypothetical protein [Pseudogemmobacter hezensis]
MTPEQAEAMAAELLPRLTRTKTCQSFCRVIVRHIERRDRRSVAAVAMNALGKTWAASTLDNWLHDKAHTREAQQKRVAAKRRWNIRNRAKRKIERDEN